MRITHRQWLGTTAVILTGLIAAAAVYVWDRNISDHEVVATAPLDPSCDIQQDTCQALFSDGGRISFTIKPRPIQGLKSLKIEVMTKGIDAHTVEVDFRGLGMNMGYNRPRLTKVSDGHYSGSGMLSVCVLERMLWEATVLAKTKDGIMTAPFRFETISP